MQQQYKLKNPTEFKSTLKTGQKVVLPSFVAFWKSNGQLPSCNFGIIASKKVGGAIQRNRCKRLLRAALMSLIHAGNLPQAPVRVVLVSRKTLLSTEFHVLQEQLTCLVELLHKTDHSSEPKG